MLFECMHSGGCELAYSALRLGDIWEPTTHTTRLNRTAAHHKYVQQYAPQLPHCTFLASKP